MNKYVCLLGKSDTGKDSLKERLLADPEFNFERLIMYTDRPKRPGEIDGVTYHFMTREDMDYMRAYSVFIDWNEYPAVWGSACYATAREEERDALFLTTCAIKQYKNFKKNLPEGAVIAIYITLPDDVRIKRSVDRCAQQNGKAKDYRELCRRFIQEQDDYNEDELTDIPWVENTGSIEETVESIKTLLREIL